MSSSSRHEDDPSDLFGNSGLGAGGRGGSAKAGSGGPEKPGGFSRGSMGSGGGAGGAGVGGGSEGVVHEEAPDATGVQIRQVPVFGANKFGFTRPQGVRLAAGIMVEREDVMSASTGASVINRIMQAFGIENESDVLKAQFCESLLLYAAINQTSKLNPANGKYYVGRLAFDYERTLKIIGEYPRQFFRLYANEMRVIVKQFLTGFDPTDEDQVWIVDTIRQVAADRGMDRSPDLCFDVAEYCSGLSPAERGLIKASRAKVISGTENSADKSVVSRPRARDAYDNTSYDKAA